LALAALDMESKVKKVALASGMEELKQRLEVLLGAKTHGAVDETEKQRQQQEAERLARRARVAEAGGQLLTAAFTFLSEMIPQREPTNGAARMTRELKDRLNECLERDDRGRPRLTVTLPDEGVLEKLARSLAAVLS
jgi:CRISPR/Cas system-associated endonuclease Cas1